MVHIKHRKGFLNPYIIGIVLIVILIFLAPKIGKKLSIGIADDYLIYDDFSKGYFDEDLWDFEGWVGDPSGDPTSPSNQDPTVSNGYLSTSASSACDVHGHTDASGNHLAYLTPTINMYGHYIKLDAGGEGTICIIMNDIEVYCGAGNGYRASSGLWVVDDYLVEAVPGFENPEMYVVKLDGREHSVIDTTNHDGDGKFKLKFKNNPSGSCSSQSSKLYYLKHKVPYNCKINDDEILIFDSFAAGSVVNISTLSHEAHKFCLDYPIKARSFEEDGIKTDIRGEILQKIVRGKSATVPQDEEWKVFYITKCTPDIELRCGIDEAYNTATGICENPHEQAMVGCKSDSDCYIPPGCTGVTVQCIGNQCAYEGVCIFQPQKDSTSLWDKIMSLAFFQWIAGLFN